MSKPSEIVSTNSKPKARAPKRAAKTRPIPSSPKKVWKVKEKKNEDPRVLSAETPTTVALATQANAITISPEMEADTLYGISIAYISTALSRGVMAFATDTDVPGFAAQYLFEVLISYATGTTVKTPNVPRWVRYLGAALSPKTVNFQAGKASYEFHLDNATKQFAGIVPIGYSNYGYTWSPVGANASLPVNGFPASDGNLSAYTEDAGASAFNKVAQFMAEKGDIGFNSQIVPSSEPCEWNKNVSAFSVVGLQEGCGQNLLGGACYQAQLEVPIFNPILSKFVRGQQPLLLQTRNFNLTQYSAGDSIVLGGFLSYFLKHVEWRARRAPRFHFVDFDEFVDVLATWVSLIQNSAYEDDAFGNKTVIPCPLTFQEFQLLLRNTFMSAFRETQPMVQSLYPRNPQASNADEFVPFVSGAGTCSLQDVGMLLPQPFIENIRSLVSRKVHIPGTREHDIQSYIGVVGRYVNNTMSTDDYTYGPEGEAINSFASPESIFVAPSKKNKKGESDSTLAEAAIDIIDGTSGSSYVFINDPARLTFLAEQWNNWLNTSGLTSYACKIGVLGSELGIKLLTGVAMTRHWNPQVGPTEPAVLDSRIMRQIRRHRGRVGDYSLKAYYAVTSQSELLTVPYQQVLSQWILPVNKAVVSNYSDANTSVQRWQEIMGQPFMAVESSGDTAVSLQQLHRRYAARMVKGKYAAGDDWDTFFTEMEKTGRGGILAGLGGLIDQFIGI